MRLVKVLKNIKILDSSFAYYLKIVVKDEVGVMRRISDILARNKISIDQQKEGEDSNNIDVVDSSLDPENHLIRKQKNKHITGMVHRLKPRYRELIILRYLDEMTYAEISKKLNNLGWA